MSQTTPPADEKPEAEKSDENPADVAEEKGGEGKEKNAEPSTVKEKSDGDGNKEEKADGEKRAEDEEKSEGAKEADNAREKSEREDSPVQDDQDKKDESDEAPAVFGVDDTCDKTNTGTEKSEDEDQDGLISKLKKKFRK